MSIKFKIWKQKMFILSLYWMKTPYSKGLWLSLYLFDEKIMKHIIYKDFLIFATKSKLQKFADKLEKRRK